MTLSPEPVPWIRRRACFQLGLLNLAIGTVLGLNYLAHVPDVGLKVWLFALPALVSSVLTLTLVPGVLFYLAGHFVRSVNLLGAVQAAFWTLFQILLFADTRIYNIFRYHFNGQVLNLVYTRGSEDAIHLGWHVWSAIVLGLLLLIGLEMWMWRRALRRAQACYDSPSRRRGLHPGLVWSAVLLPMVFVEKTIYAQASLSRDRTVTHLARVFPLYARVPVKDLASKVLGVEPPAPRRFELEGFELDYPLEHPRIAPDGPRPNVLIVAVDCWRKDMLSSEVTPHLAAWAERGCRRFEDHVSAGNSTRYGLFSMFYGLHGSYWFPFLAERRSPVLVDELLELGYEFGVFGSASMGYPELRDTVWSRVPHAVHDDFGQAESWRRDELAAEALGSWLEAREDDPDPFFAFLLLDSPHQVYSHPPGETPFTPSAPELDYMSMTRNEGPTPELLEAVRNRYKNAVHHADSVAGALLEELEGSKLGANTIVVVTGDHGEEFRECGFFGHTSAFTPPQIVVPFLMRGPSIENGVEERATSHLDFAPTLLELLGADPDQRGQWSLGANLFDPPAGRRRVMSGWNELGVWTPGGIVRVPLSLLEFDIDVYDYGWRLISDDLPVLQAERATLEQLGAECNRFLKK